MTAERTEKPKKLLLGVHKSQEARRAAYTSLEGYCHGGKPATKAGSPVVSHGKPTKIPLAEAQPEGLDCNDRVLGSRCLHLVTLADP